MSDLRLNLRRQTLETDAEGYIGWEAKTEEEVLPTSEVALLLCDVWDRHWCRGAAERLEAMIPRMNATANAARDRGVHLLHAPSETMEFYAGTPARERMKRIPHVEPPEPLDLPDPPLPIDDSDNGCDTGEKPWYRAWTRQHPGIEIDHDRDGISDSAAEIYSYLMHHRIRRLLVMGIHTNMCVLHRSFGIKRMVRWGVPVALVRDLTDTMYNPALSPYVSHEEGTRLVVAFIERFWCPTLESGDLFPGGE
ncbi:MAG: isochorismatase family protein [Armatimonadetes bacterium]|nr:isochorismatase family protein [Armatimonadota bacterium]